jgi:hypothetical protein
VGLLLLAATAEAGVNLPGDVPYYRLRQGRTLYLYDSSAREFIDQLAAYNQAVRTMYDKSFGWTLDEEMDLILLSPHQQVTNAYATVVPNIKTVWFPSGVGALEEMAASSWLLTLSAHETSHLYQLNSKGSLNSGLKKILGNSVVFFPFLWPVFIHPNLFTPTFLVEGNATMNESRLNMGGRLHSGEKRAFVLAQIDEGLIDPVRLINDGFEWPFGEESYMQGAYFQAHLAAKYGIEKTNSFFRAQGEHYFWPLILNKTFRTHFGESYAQEIREYVREMEALASKQQATPGESLIDTWFISPMNHDSSRVFFLATKHKAPPELVVFDKKSQKIVSRRMINIPSGKVFWEGSEPLTAAADQHDLRHIEYSLYGENARFIDKYRGQLVTDQRAGKTVALDAANAWLDPRVLVDGEAYDIAHSNAILDEGGNVYYFRQNGSERLLYKNREPLIKFDGFYAKPTEVTADGTFYFIGNTDYGSTLYQLRGKEIVRVLKSDRVIDARSIGDDRFLVTETGAYGESIKIAKAERKAQNPAVYQYGFAVQNFIPEKAIDKAEIAAVEKPYSSLREMRYSGLDAQFGWSDGSGLSSLVLANFTDPMEHQQFSVGANTAEYGDDTYLIRYAFTKYLPQYFIEYLYEEDEMDLASGLHTKSYDQSVTAGAFIPVWRWRDWDAAVSLAGIYEKEDVPNTEHYGSLTSLQLQYQIAPFLGFLPWRNFTFSYTNRLESELEEWTKANNTSLVQLKYVHGFPYEFYGSLSGNIAWAETHDIEVDYEPYSLSRDIRIPRITSHNEMYEAKTAGNIRLEVNKVFTTPSYGARFPIGLNRVAPVVVAQGIFLDDDAQNRYPQNTFEWGYGADVELLLTHRIPVQVRLLQAYDTRYPQKMENELQLKLHREF